MKKIIIYLAAIAAVVSSCSLMDDVFDGSDDQQSREFTSKDWSSVERNVFSVESQGAKKESMSVVFPESGDVVVYTDYNNGKMSLLFKSFQIVEPTEQPDDWPIIGIPTWIKSAFEVYLFVDDVPYKMTENGELTFSQKTVKGVLKYCHHSYDNAVFYKSVENCKVSMTGDLVQEASKGAIIADNPLRGNLEIKIIPPKADRNILYFKELKPSVATKDYLDFIKQY